MCPSNVLCTFYNSTNSIQFILINLKIIYKRENKRSLLQNILSSIKNNVKKGNNKTNITFNMIYKNSIGLYLKG